MDQLRGIQDDINGKINALLLWFFIFFLMNQCIASVIINRIESITKTKYKKYMVMPGKQSTHQEDIKNS